MNGKDLAVAVACAFGLSRVPALARLLYLPRVHAAAAHAIETQGASSAASPKAHAAVHEAGHAIIAQSVGMRPPLVWIEHDQERGGWTGACEHGSATILTVPSACIRFAAITVAGRCAEELAFGNDVRLLSSLDELFAARYYAAQAIMIRRNPDGIKSGGFGPDELHSADASAMNVMRSVFTAVVKHLTRHRMQLDAIARTLRRRRRISHADLASLLSSVEPMCLRRCAEEAK